MSDFAGPSRRPKTIVVQPQNPHLQMTDLLILTFVLVQARFQMNKQVLTLRLLLYCSTKSVLAYTF
jgi:hypothetical protein